MKYAFTLLLAVLLLMGCGHLSGNNPEGVTGGSTTGYGSFGQSFSSEFFIDYILGSWQQNLDNGSNNVVTFSSDGTIRVELQAGNSVTGTYFISGNRLDMHVSGWKTGSETITVNGDTMTLAKDGATTVLHKIG